MVDIDLLAGNDLNVLSRASILFASALADGRYGHNADKAALGMPGKSAAFPGPLESDVDEALAPSTWSTNY